MRIGADCRCDVAMYNGISASMMVAYSTLLLVIVFSCDTYLSCTSCNESKKINLTVRKILFNVEIFIKIQIMPSNMTHFNVIYT